jgi:hypothetical protein
MTRIFAGMLLIAGVTTAAYSETNHTIQGWPQGLATIPCDAFMKNADGSWTQTRTIIVEPGHNTMSHNTFSNTGETKILDARCGK